MAKFGTRLKKAREKAGLSQKQLAEGMGWTAEAGQRRVSYYERSEGEPTYPDLARMARCLKVSAAYLAFGTVSERLPDEPGIEADLTPINLTHIPKFGSSDDEAGIQISQSVLEGNGKIADPEWLTLTDNNMEPQMPIGTVVFFDRQDTAIHSGQSYVVEHGGLVRINQVYELPKGAVRLRSQNATEWPEEVIENPQESGFQIIGKVRGYLVTV